MTLPIILTVLATFIFLIVERVFPGRNLPRSKGWYVRSLGLNFVQLVATLIIGKIWIYYADSAQLISLEQLIHNPIIEGFIGWFVGTFIFYWWHRLRHVNGWWHVFHQIHHSAKRIEILTSFYKHPIEIITNAILIGAILYLGLGVSIESVAWYNFFAATGEYFYHGNFRSLPWMRYFIQTPELHSIHHQLNVHNYNFGDITLWDRLFGTYKDTTTFAKKCGFPRENEQKMWKMLTFRDVYNEK